jgi:murein DD-endopeptidase MepM/ murein hydrolase activator NlpD
MRTHIGKGLSSKVMFLQRRLLLMLIGFPVAAIAAAAQQPITYTPVAIHSGSPILFRAALPEATAVTGIWLTHTLVFSRTGDRRSWFVLAGVDVEQEPGSYPVEVTETLASGTTRKFSREIAVGPASYRTTTLTVPDKFVEPDEATKVRLAKEAKIKEAAFAKVTPEPLWMGSFARPVASAPTDSFGTRRTFNGTLASIHKGADFHAALGTPVYASNDGVVLIAQPMFYEGNFVLVDHGQQLLSMYMHFSRIDVRVGEHVRKGQRLGLSGATGRVTGPHLHFGVRWQGAYLDPALLLTLPLPGPGAR